MPTMSLSSSSRPRPPTGPVAIAPGRAVPRPTRLLASLAAALVAVMASPVEGGQWSRLGEGCCRFGEGPNMRGHPELFSRVQSASACKQRCEDKDGCVAIEFNGMQQMCELHDAVPTHNATGSANSGCDPAQTKCLRVACWIPQPPNKGPITEGGAAPASAVFAGTDEPCGDLCRLDPNVLAFAERDLSPTTRDCTCYTTSLKAQLYDRSRWQVGDSTRTHGDIIGWIAPADPGTRGFEIQYGTRCA